MKMFKKALVVLLIATLLLPSMAFAKDNAKIANVLDFTGEVQVKKGGGEKLFKVFKNMALTQGDTIITGKDGKATIELDKDKEVSIGPETQLLISELVSSIKAESGKTSLNLLGGKVMVKVKEKLKGDSKFEIKTPTSVMGVRGTMFFVSVDPLNGNSYVAVFDGIVAASNRIEQGQGATSGEPTLINPNQQMSFDGTSSSEPGAPEPLNIDDMDSFGLEELVNEMEDRPEQVDIPGLQERANEILAKIEEKRAQEAQARQQREQQQLQDRLQRISHTDPSPPAPPVVYEPENPYIPPAQPTSIQISGIKDIEVPYGGEASLTVKVVPSDAKLIASYSGDQQGLIELHTTSVVGDYEIRIQQPYKDLEVTLTASKDGYQETIQRFYVNVDYSDGPYIDGPFTTNYYLDTYVDMEFTLYLNGDSLTGIVNNRYSESEPGYEFGSYDLEGNTLVLFAGYFEESFTYFDKNDAKLELQFESGKKIQITIYFVEKPILSLVNAYIHADQKTVDFVFDHEVHPVHDNLEWNFYHSQINDIFLPIYATNSIKKVEQDGNILRMTFEKPFQGNQNRFLFDEYVFGAVIITESLSAGGLVENININLNRMMEGLYFILPVDVSAEFGSPALFYKTCSVSDQCGQLTPMVPQDDYNVYPISPDFVEIRINIEISEINTNFYAQYSDQEEQQLIFTVSDYSYYFTPLEIVETVVNDVYNEVTFKFNQEVYIYDDNLYSLREMIELSRDGQTYVPLGQLDEVEIGVDQRSLTISLATPLAGNNNRFIVRSWMFRDQYYNSFNEEIVTDLIVNPN